jgi:glycosyltransferase involved in cell wall biosynthesis
MQNPKIYFICPKNRFAHGGIKQIYRQVYFLRKNGFDAYLLKKIPSNDNWFNLDIPVKYSREIFKKIKFAKLNYGNDFFNRQLIKYLRSKSILISKEDILVFPEIFGPNIGKVYPNNPKVIFNQNCYYTFSHFSMFNDIENHIYNNPKLIGTIVASSDAENYLSFTFPKINVLKIRLGIDSSIFKYSSEKKKQIAYMPRKLPEDVLQVLNILQNRSNFDSWKFVPIENKSESEVAQIMLESAIFLSFNHTEGFGLPPAEAMACGCIVIGYKGQGGKDYLNTTYSYPIDDGNVASFAKTIEEVISEFSINENAMKKKGKLASDFILGEFNLENEEKDVLKVWQNILQIDN